MKTYLIVFNVLIVYVTLCAVILILVVDHSWKAKYDNRALPTGFAEILARLLKIETNETSSRSTLNSTFPASQVC